MGKTHDVSRILSFPISNCSSKRVETIGYLCQTDLWFQLKIIVHNHAVHVSHHECCCRKFNAPQPCC